MSDDLVDSLEKDVAALILREQERLGRQLHDTLGPQLTALSMLATSLHDRLQARSAEETALAAKLIRGIEVAKAEARALAKGMLPVEIDAEGLMCALQQLSEDTSSTYPIRCLFQCNPAVTLHDNFKATRLFRIANEAVHNAVKHSYATELVIRLCDQPSLRLEVEDNGRGFATPLDVIEGNGIRIMRFRSQLIGAHLDIQPGQHGGTIVSCTNLPRNPVDD